MTDEKVWLHLLRSENRNLLTSDKEEERSPMSRHVRDCSRPGATRASRRAKCFGRAHYGRRRGVVLLLATVGAADLVSEYARKSPEIAQGAVDPESLLNAVVKSTTRSRSEPRACAPTCSGTCHTRM